jgi:hypothetical protein
MTKVSSDREACVEIGIIKVCDVPPRVSTTFLWIVSELFIEKEALL